MVRFLMASSLLSWILSSCVRVRLHFLYAFLAFFVAS